MRNRYAVPTLKTLERYRLERDTALAKARIIYNSHGDARQVISSVAEARQWQHKVIWAKRVLRAA